MGTQEDAYFAALLVVVKTAVEAGMDRAELAGRLQDLAERARASDCLEKASILDTVAGAIEPKRHRFLKHFLEIIEGGKSGQKSN